MRNLERLAALCMLALAALPPRPLLAAPTSTWMTEEAMRAAFIGKTLDGHYVDGLRWTETYGADGRLDYRESARNGLGPLVLPRQRLLHVLRSGLRPQRRLLDTRSRPAPIATSSILPVSTKPQPEDEAAPGPLGGWAARAWRQGEPSTCEDKPSV